MGRQRKISGHVLAAMNNFLDNEKYIGQIARSADLLFITDGSWLKDTAVIDAISSKQGAWDVYLIFAHYKNPLQLIVRKITRCFSEGKAITASYYMRRQAAKDQRGTLAVALKDLNLCIN